MLRRYSLKRLLEENEKLRSAGAGTDLDVIERRPTERVMREGKGNKAQPLRELGITRTQLYMRLRKHGLERVGARRSDVR